MAYDRHMGVTVSKSSTYCYNGDCITCKGELVVKDNEVYCDDKLVKTFEKHRGIHIDGDETSLKMPFLKVEIDESKGGPNVKIDVPFVKVEVEKPNN